MSTEWYIMSSPIYTSGYEGEVFNDYVNDELSELLGVGSPISSTVSTVNASGTILSTFQAVVQNNSSDNVQDGFERQIITANGILSTGNYVQYKSKIWLVNSLVGNNNIYDKATMTICNYTLKFQNSLTGAVLSYPAIYDSVTTNLSDQKMMTIINGTSTIKLAFDSLTSANLVIGKRLIIDNRTGITSPNVFKITSVDTVSTNGLLTLRLEVDEFNSEKDSLANWVADFKTVVASTGTAKILYSGDCIVKIGGVYKTFTAEFRDGSGNILNLTPIWSISHPSGTSYFTTIEDAVNKTIKIKCADVESLIGTTLTLNLTESTHTYSGSISVSIISLI